MKHHVIYLGIIVSLLVIILGYECVGRKDMARDVEINGRKYEVVQEIVDTVYVKASPEVRYKPGKTIYRDTVIYLDTSSFMINNPPEGVKERFCDSIMISYYAKKVFKDTITFSGIGNVYILDTIQHNEILSRMVNSDLIFKSTSKTVTVKEKAKNELYFGPRIDFSEGVVTPHIGLLLKTAKNRIYGVSLGAGKSPIYSGSIYIKF